MNFSSVTRVAHRTAYKLKKNSPQILFYGGIVGTVATTVLASRATLKAVPVAEELKFSRELLDEDMAKGRVSEDVYTQEATRQYVTAAGKMTKLYAPTVIVGGLSIAALTKSHQQLTSRNTALTMAYTGLFKTFENYRGRVREQLGTDIDQQFLHGTVTEEIAVEGKDGKVKTKEITSLDKMSLASTTVLYDSKNAGSWSKDPGYNQTYLDNQQSWANVLLQRKGYLFLNEVLDMLQIPGTPEGQLIGWLFRDVGGNETWIDFGHHKDGEFVAGYAKDVLLDFNAYPILDQI